MEYMQNIENKLQYIKVIGITKYGISCDGSCSDSFHMLFYWFEFASFSEDIFMWVPVQVKHLG